MFRVFRLRQTFTVSARNGRRAANIARARELLAMPVTEDMTVTQEPASSDEAKVLPQPCPCCGSRMIVIETFEAGAEPKSVPTIEGIDSS